MKSSRMPSSSSLCLLALVFAEVGCGDESMTSPADVPTATDTNINFASTATSCEGPEDCDTSPKCAVSGTGTCVLRKEVGFATCSYAPKGITASATCPCYEGGLGFCYLSTEGNTATLGLRTCQVTDGLHSKWSTCQPLAVATAASP